MAKLFCFHTKEELKVMIGSIKSHRKKKKRSDETLGVTSF